MAKVVSLASCAERLVFRMAREPELQRQPHQWRVEQELLGFTSYALNHYFMLRCDVIGTLVACNKSIVDRFKSWFSMISIHHEIEKCTIFTFVVISRRILVQSRKRVQQQSVGYLCFAIGTPPTAP